MDQQEDDDLVDGQFIPESKRLLLGDEVPARRRSPAVSTRAVLAFSIVFMVGFFVGLIFLGASRRVAVNGYGQMHIPARMPLPRISDDVDPATGKPQAWFSGPCGQLSTRAASNCTLDLLSFSWLPSECFTEEDQRDAEDFQRLQPWRYEQQDHGEIADIAELLEAKRHHAAGQDRLHVFTSGEWHRVHCAFMFRRLQRKLARGEPVDSYMASQHHGEHCQAVIIGSQEQWEWERKGASVRTRVWLKYPECI